MFRSFEEIAKQYGNCGQIHFTNVSAGETVSLPAFITQFQDNYTVGYGGEQSFGRTDPVKHYQSTSRNIQASLDILSFSEKSAELNFAKYSKLIRMLYPVYSTKIASANNARTIKAPPLWRIRYANYIKGDHPAGLLGVCSGFTFQPEFDMGHHITKNGDLVPLVYTMNLTFEPIHESPLGYEEGSPGTFINKKFPYDIILPEGGEGTTL